MPLRAALAAALICLCRPGLGAAAGPAGVDRSADSRATVKTMKTMIMALPESSVKKSVLPVLERLDQKAAKLPQDKQEAFIAQNLPELTALATGLSRDVVPKEVLKQVQNNAAYLNNRANRWEESRLLSERVLSVDPEDRDALLNRSNANYGLKNFNSSFEDADKAARLDPNNPDAYAARALACYGKGEYLQTLEDARRALALNPNDRTAYALMHLAEGRVPPVTIRGDAKSRLDAEVQREYHGMVTQLTQVETKSKELPTSPKPQSVERLIRNAATKIALKDYYGAIADADKALAEDSTNTAAYYYRAAAYNLIGQYETAASNATQALSIDPTEVASRDARSYAYNHLGRFNDAIADANHSLELSPLNPYAFANRGFAHEKMGKIEDMLADLKKAAELNPQFEPVYHDAASAYGIDVPPSQSRPAPPAAPAPAVAPKQKQFLVILLSSVLGGILIAFGLLHVFGAQWLRKAPEAKLTVAGLRDMHGRSAIDDAYELGAPLGKGGMGVVYAAVDRALGRKVAIKMLSDESQLDLKAKEQFLAEARTVAALHHPNIVDIHSIMSDEKGLYLVFEFISGKTVEDRLARQGRLSLAEVKTLLKPVCAALEFAHQRHVVHRDLKPSNIMITDEGVVKVMDFGISRRIMENIQAAAGGGRDYEVTNSVVGTPYYMAPEQEYGIVRPESDIYSLGTCLYEMVTGTRPYPPPASYAQKLAANYEAASVREPSLPLSLDMLIAGALHPDPEKRIRSATDFYGMLDAVRDSDAALPPS